MPRFHTPSASPLLPAWPSPQCSQDPRRPLRDAPSSHVSSPSIRHLHERQARAVAPLAVGSLNSLAGLKAGAAILLEVSSLFTVCRLSFLTIFLRSIESIAYAGGT